MNASPRVLLTIDYEPWFALSRRFDRVADPRTRKTLDAGFTLEALEPILSILDNKPITFYLVGEIADWYPAVPEKIVDAGHELGFHCQLHRSLTEPEELRQDLISSRAWRQKYQVTGYRAPMVGIADEGYRLLHDEGFVYSSSIYAPTGNIHPRGGVIEVPVSTSPIFTKTSAFSAPRPFNSRLLMSGEIPIGSSFMIGFSPNFVFKQIEKELNQGLSPVIILHPYEIYRPKHFTKNMLPDLLQHPQLLPFMRDKSKFLKRLLNTFPTGPMRDHVMEAC